MVVFEGRGQADRAHIGGGGAVLGRSKVGLVERGGDVIIGGKVEGQGGGGGLRGVHGVVVLRWGKDEEGQQAAGEF